MKTLIRGVFLAGATLALVVGCNGENGNDIEYDCDTICTGWATCADEYGTTEIEQAACVAQCEARAEQGTAQAEEARECQLCLADEPACAEEVACADECAELVPPIPPRTAENNTSGG